MGSAWRGGLHRGGATDARSGASSWVGVAVSGVGGLAVGRCRVRASGSCRLSEGILVPGSDRTPHGSEPLLGFPRQKGFDAQGRTGYIVIRVCWSSLGWSKRARFVRPVGCPGHKDGSVVQQCAKRSGSPTTCGLTKNAQAWSCS